MNNNEQKRYPDQEKQSPKIPPEVSKEYRDNQTSDFKKKNNMNEDTRKVRRDEDDDTFKKQNPNEDIVRDRTERKNPSSDKWM